MYTKRNAIYLLIAVVVTITAGFLISNNLKKQHAKIVAQHNKLKEEYTNSDNIARTLPQVKFMYDSLRSKWLDAPKKILALPEPQLTVSYMVWLAEHYNLDMQFDFKIDEIKQSDIISYFSFTLTGATQYKDLYTFIFYMTQNPILYKFESLSLNRNEENKIEYEIQMKGFFLRENILPGEQFNFAQKQALNAEDGLYDIFYTTYQPPIDDVVKNAGPGEDNSASTKEAEFLDPQRASLLALTSNTAYILNGEGIMRRLSPGSHVDGGQLLYIDQERSEAQFQLYGGKRIALGLGYKKEL